MKTVKEILDDRRVITVQDSDSVQSAARKMADNTIGALPVFQEDRLVGIFTERDIISKVVSPGKDITSVKVRDVMTRHLVIAYADDTVDACTAKMNHAKIRHLPVIEDDHLIGIISIRDLLAHDMNEKQEKIEILEQYIFTLPPGMEKRK